MENVGKIITELSIVEKYKLDGNFLKATPLSRTAFINHRDWCENHSHKMNSIYINYSLLFI